MSQSGNVATYSVTINSDQVGTFVVSASDTVNFTDPNASAGHNTASVSVSTNGSGGNSGPATKNYVNATIAITPNAVNAVSTSETFTVTVTVLTPATTAGQAITFSFGTPTISYSQTPDLLAPTSATFVSQTGNVATYSVTINSDQVGTFVVSASDTVNFTDPNASAGHNTASVSVSTSGSGANSGPATKNYVNATIAITPNAVNAVGTSETFTVTVTVLTPATTAGQAITFSFGTPTISYSQTPDLLAPTSATFVSQTGNVATYSVTINSDQVGTFVVSASDTVNFTDPNASAGHNTASVSVSTSGGNSGPATKNYVNATIAITPNAVNAVGTSETFTVTVTALTPATTAGQAITFSFGTPTISYSQTPDLLAPTSATFVSQTGNVATYSVTINSDQVGTFVVSASDTVNFTDPNASAGHNTASVSVSTSGSGANSGPATKNYVNATIAITPNAVNAVGTSETFTVTVTVLTPATTAGQAITFSFGTPTISYSQTPDLLAPTSATFVSQSGNVATYSVTINSDQVGTFVVSASDTANFTDPNASAGHNTASVSVSTSGSGANSGPATKNYVNATIAITPNAVNAVGTSETFTVTVTALTPATTAGQAITFSFGTPTISYSQTPDLLAPTSATFVSQSGNVATYSVTINSDQVGTFVVSASDTVNFTDPNASAGHNTASVSVSTSGSGGNSGPATKNYVNATIAITPNAVNAVGTSETFTVTVTALTPATTAGQAITFSFGTPTISYSQTPDLLAPTSATFVSQSGNVATYSVTINSDQVGTFVVSASDTVNFTDPNASAGHNTASVSVSTDSTGANSGPATKNYVNATIAITPNAVNAVGTSETFTVTVTALTPATTAGQAITFSFGTPTISYSQTPDLLAPTSATFVSQSGNVATYSVTINSDQVGTFVVSASDTVNFTDPNASAGHNTASVTVSTDGTGANSGPATKNYVNATIAITPNAVNAVGTSETFTVTVTALTPATTAGQAITFSFGTPTISYSQTPDLLAPTSATFVSQNGNVATYSLTINSDQVGTFVVSASDTVNFTDPNASAGHNTASVTVSTDGTGANSGPATKYYIALSTTPGGMVMVGSSLSDSAALSGGNNPQGTITFYLMAPGSTSTTPLDSAVYTATVPVNGDGTYDISQATSTTGSTAASVIGTYQWVVVYSGDTNNPANPMLTSSFGSEPETVFGGLPVINITKTADQSSITAGSPIGFTVTITNTGTSAATGLVLNDPLPPGADFNWSIKSQTDTDFTITGSQGSQVLQLTSNGTTLAAGDGETVDVTSPTTNNDVPIPSTPNGPTGSAFGFDLGTALDYVIITGPTVKSVQTTADSTYVGNVGISTGLQGTLTSGSNSVTGLTSGGGSSFTTANLSVGESVFGIGIPAGTTISQINSSTQITLSQNATVSDPEDLTFGTGANQPSPPVQWGATLDGNMDFAGTPSNTNSNNINGSVNANVGAINSDYQDIVNMSTVLFGEPGTTLTLTGNAQEINVPDTGPFDANGNYIYTATSGFNVQNTLYINGDGTHSVVINIPADAAVKFGAPILLTGDVTALTLTTVGHGFTPGTYALTISAPTSGMPGATTATGTYTVNAAGQVSGITLTNGGRGYSPGQPINVTFGGGGGSGATALATLGVLNDNQVMYNLDPSPGNTTEIHGGAGINNLPVNGIIVGATAKFNVDNLVSAGHLYLGGTGTDFQLVSNIKNLVTPITVNNTATLNGTLTASAGVTISYNQSLPPLTAAGTLAAHEAAGQYPLGSVRPGVYTVAVDGLTGAQSSAEQARISDAIAGLNATFAPFGVTLTEVSGAAAADASVHIRMATTTVLGNTVNGVLGDFEGSTINLVTGWNWYTGSDPRQIGADQYDFETIVMHELGHVFGLGESADPGSVMYYQLAPGEVRLGLTASDLAQLEDQGQTHADTIVSDTTAAPVASRPTPAVTETRSDNPETADANPLSAQAAEPADEIEADNAGNASLVSTGFSSPPDRGRGNPAPGGGVPLVLSIGGTNLGGWPIVEPLPIGWALQTSRFWTPTRSRTLLGRRTCIGARYSSRSRTRLRTNPILTNCWIGSSNRVATRCRCEHRSILPRPRRQHSPTPIGKTPALWKNSARSTRGGLSL